MKKVLFSFFAFILITVSCVAQGHLTFKGIPIEGTMDGFCEKLEAKGFERGATKDNVTAFSGDFTGRQATVWVAATSDGQEVFSVVAFFESMEEWKQLVGTYNYYKNLYTRKYGEPQKVMEDESSLGRGDHNVTYLWRGELVWKSIWVTSGGDIELKIDKTDEVYKCAVFISYRDYQNIEKKMQEDLKDI